MRWLSFFKPRTWVLLIALALLGGLAGLYAAAPRPSETLVLLVPDRASLEYPATQAWIDAAAEEGVPLQVMTDDEFMRYSGNSGGIRGVILPDTVHQRASDLLVSLLHSYVSAGGKLFMAFDAGVLDAQTGSYAPGQSRLSKLAGVRYAMYGDLRDLTIARGAVYGTRESEKALDFQPGKLDFKYSSHANLGELTTYGYARLHHSYYRTGTSLGGSALLKSFDNDVVIGKNRLGKGDVLFANLPLGYLKTRTDGYMLHLLLRHFGIQMAGLPYLSPVPHARGGLVLNLHVDSSLAQAPLLQLEALGWFKAGPFSIHVTAGPDTLENGDNLGLNVDNNPVIQAYLKRMVALGHEVGNHGGWNHDIYGGLANAQNRAEFEPWLELNHRSISTAIGKPARTYSAPEGNQPVWSTHWLERNGFKGYYFTGDTGLGPTRSYYEGKRPARVLWAFPVSNYLKIATFEELDHPKTPLTADDIGTFLTRLANYVSEQRVARLFYFHPPAASRYMSTMEGLMAEAQRLSEHTRFNWYTMERLSDFLTRREKTRWTLAAQGNERILNASNSDGLDEMSWVFPTAGANRFDVRKGKATVRREGTQWILTAGKGNDLQVVIR